MKNNLKLLSSFIILSTLVVLFVFSASAWGCGGCNPPCGPCQTCQGGICVNTCLSSLCQTCVNGSCQSRCDPISEKCVNGQCVPLSCISYTYDEVGNRTSMTDPNGTTSYIYDYLNRLTSVTNPDLKTISYQYDASGNRIQLTDPAGNITAYTYDGDNRLIDVNASTASTTYQYDSLGNLTRADYPNGTYTQYSYNSQRNWLVSLVNKDSTGVVLSSYSYTCDKVGNRLSVTEHDGSAVSYGYDNIYQLTSETRTGTNPYTITYQYDNAGNRTQMIKNAVTTNYAYNNNNQLKTETTGGTTVTYSYDGNGNLLSKTAGANTTLYAWGWNNRLLSVSGLGGNTLYEYDGDGTRISKTQAGIRTKYINDMASPLTQVIMETDNAGIVQATYNYGDDLISMNRADVNSFYLCDGLGSTRQLTADNQTVAASYTYESFGGLIASSGATENNYLFTGEQFDSSSGLLYLRARYYNPQIGRFISRDPILEPMHIEDNFLWFVPFLRSYSQIFNSYNYAYNNPVNFVDPLGLKSECEIWEEEKDTDDGCGGILNAAQCSLCCTEKFTKKVPWRSWPWKWPAWFDWVYGCQSACEASQGKIGPNIPTP